MENVAPRGECGPVPGRVQARRRKSGPPAHVRPAGAGPAHQAHQARRRRSDPPGPPGPPAQVRPTGSSTPVEKGCLI